MEKRVLVVSDLSLGGELSKAMVQRLTKHGIKVIVPEMTGPADFGGKTIVTDIMIAELMMQKMAQNSKEMIARFAEAMREPVDHRQHLNKPAGKKLQYYHNRRRY